MASLYGGQQIIFPSPVIGRGVRGEGILLTLTIFTLLLLITGYIAGIVGSLTGLGGAVILIPVLILFLDVNIYYTIGASIMAVIANSSGAAMAYLQGGYTNLRIGMFLETTAVVGALVGGILILYINPNILGVILGFVLILSAYFTIKRKEDNEPQRTSHSWAVKLQLESDYPTKKGVKAYQVQGVPLAWGAMFIAGVLSSLLGIGSGVFKVLAMDQAMKLPYKVATATSNFMIGITAAVAAGIYFSRGYIDPVITFPVVIGVLFGALSGAKMLPKINVHALRIFFSIIITVLAVQLVYKGLTGHF